MTIILAIFSGLGLGYIIERGDLCFHSTLRGLVRVPKQLDLFRAYILALLRGESLPRYLGLAAGGFLMGIGAAIAGGCNLGHSLVGVPLLSLGSITTTVSMLVGVWAADRVARWYG